MFTNTLMEETQRRRRVEFQNQKQSENVKKISV